MKGHTTMSSAMYLNNAKEIAAAARVAKSLGYVTSNADIKSNDRYVMNIVSRLAGGDIEAQRELETAIVGEVEQVRL
jgi:hypothetical protein